MKFGTISIIMAAFNAEPFITEAIESVIAQSYRDWELIIVNDGSTDQTENLILLFNDKRVSSYKIEHSGVSAARNFGLRKMTGEYYTFFDADDLLTTESLLSRVRIFQGNGSACFVDGNVEVYGQNFKRLLYRWAPKRNGHVLASLINLSGDCFFGPTWLIRRDATPKVYFDENLTHGEDLLQFIELATQGGDYQFTDEVILKYRRHGDSAMTDLEGLKIGYFSMYKSLSDKGIISGKQQRVFRKKMLSILIKSYLARFRLKGIFNLFSDYIVLTSH